MTLKQAHKRYPHVPAYLVLWAIENVDDPDVLHRGLMSLEKAIRLQRQVAA
jgi:hypothetical protein